MKEIGNFINRLEENRYFNGTHDNIKVGTPCTIYLYSDRHAYEVIEVKDQNNIRIRQLKAIRTDNFGMSDCQNYRYERDEKGCTMTLRLTKDGWKEVNTYTLQGFEKAVKRFMADTTTEQVARNYIAYHWRLAGLTEKQFAKVMAGGEVVKVKGKVSISFGVADEYYDYSF